MIASVANLFVVEAAIVLGTRMPQRVVMRVIGLNQNSTRQITTSGAPGHLSYQLKGSFGGTEIRQGQSRIDRNHANQSHVVKVVSFRQHLSADQQIDFAFVEVEQNLFKLAPSRFSIAIDPPDPQLWKPFPQDFFNLLRAFTNVIDVFANARRTL